MSADVRVPGSPRRGRRRGRSWSRSASRSPSPRGGRADGVDVRDSPPYRSRSRSRDGVRDDDRRGRDGPPGVPRDDSRDARARRETPTEPHSNDTHKSGVGLGYRREDDGALRAALGDASPSARASGFGSREGALLARPPDREKKGRAGGDYNPLRREDEVAARRERARVRGAPATGSEGKKKTSPTTTTSNAASYEYLVASGSLGWRASGGALPRRAEAIGGVGDETLAPLTESLRDAREASRKRREASDFLSAQTRDGSNGFEALESRRALATRRVGAATRHLERSSGKNDHRLGDGVTICSTNDLPSPAGGGLKTNRGVADRARADELARAEPTFASSADGVRESLARKAERYERILLLSKTGPNDCGVDFDAKSAADAAAFRKTEPTFAEVPPPPPFPGPRGDDAAARAKKRERLLALRNRGRERMTTAADGADA